LRVNSVLDVFNGVLNLLLLLVTFAIAEFSEVIALKVLAIACKGSAEVVILRESSISDSVLSPAIILSDLCLSAFEGICSEGTSDVERVVA
jgi:hypothetical protein